MGWLHAKFIQIAVSRDPRPMGSECLYALDENGEVWWRDVSEGTKDSEPWTPMNNERSRKTLQESLGGKPRKKGPCGESWSCTLRSGHTGRCRAGKKKGV